ncbi:MAG: hypothetical protein PWQ89_1845 [Verrucomicrobiota bacterium]|jgi:LysM repeat protein|nr:hypothetical protein [Verrucomicrobiota bacterium]
MKAKFIGLMVLVLHVIVLAGFSLMQGCTTGKSPVPWLNWPYSTSQEEPMISPADNYAAPMLSPIPADSYSSGYSSSDYSSTLDSSRSPVEGHEQVYSVQKGDTLSSIAAMYGTSWKKLSEYNGLSDPNRLRIGQEIRIPPSLGGASVSAPVKRASSSSSAAASRPKQSSIPQGTSYVIQRGDTLATIAKRSGVTVAELKAANGLTSDRIIAGKSLTIPKKGKAKAPVVTNASPAASVSPEPAPAPMAGPSSSASTASVSSASTTSPVYEHVLYPGETLEDVARQYGSSKSEIMTLNGITDPSSVKPGTKLLVPIPE